MRRAISRSNAHRGARVPLLPACGALLAVLAWSGVATAQVACGDRIGAGSQAILAGNLTCAQGEVLTVEGLAVEGRLHPIQQAFVDHGALQCGFCTPGMVLAVKALLDLEPGADEATIRHFLRGNICRCTGYVKILDAVKDLIATSGGGT